MSFTPGPWDFSWEIQPNGCPTVGHKGLMVCMVAHSAKEPDQKETAIANASLIAAAPELLEALEALEDAYCDVGPDMSREKRANGRKALIAARAAIAKARGEGG